MTSYQAHSSVMTDETVEFMFFIIVTFLFQQSPTSHILEHFWSVSTLVNHYSNSHKSGKRLFLTLVCMFIWLLFSMLNVSDELSLIHMN